MFRIFLRRDILQKSASLALLCRNDMSIKLRSNRRQFIHLKSIQHFSTRGKNFEDEDHEENKEKNGVNQTEKIKEKVGIKDEDDVPHEEFKTKISRWITGFKEGLYEAAHDLVGIKSKEKSTIVRKLRPLDPEEQEKQKELDPKSFLPVQVIAPEASGAMTIVKTATEVWEVLNEKLKESQLIQDILAGGEAISKKTGLDKAAKSAKSKVKDRMEDVSEAWETSQHPLVYKASSVWDKMTAETDAAVAQKLLRQLDPYFNIEEWKADVAREVLPDVMGGWLRGDPDVMRRWLQGDVLKKFLAEIEARKKADRIMDPHVLDIRHVDIVTFRLDGEYAHNPALVVVFMLQHIDCIKNSKGEIISGTDAHATASHFLISFHRRYNEEKQELRWIVGDIQDVGASSPFY